MHASAARIEAHAVVVVETKSGRPHHPPLALPSPLPPLRPADARGKFDELVEQDGVRILIDPAALMHVLGTKMDFIDEPLR